MTTLTVDRLTVGPSTALRTTTYLGQLRVRHHQRSDQRGVPGAAVLPVLGVRPARARCVAGREHRGVVDQARRTVHPWRPRLHNRPVAPGFPAMLSTTRRDVEAARPVRAACLALPQSSERPSHGGPAFFIRDKKCFVMFLDDHHEDGRLAIWCAAPDGVQAEMVETEPDRFFRPPYVGHRGWLGVHLLDGRRRRARRHRHRRLPYGRAADGAARARRHRADRLRLAMRRLPTVPTVARWSRRSRPSQTAGCTDHVRVDEQTGSAVPTRGIVASIRCRRRSGAADDEASPVSRGVTERRDLRGRAVHVTTSAARAAPSDPTEPYT